MSDYRMLSSEDIEIFKAQGWPEEEIAELELYLLNNTTRGLYIQSGAAWREAFRPLLEATAKLLNKIGKKK